MLKRRVFLQWSSLFTLSSLLYGKKSHKEDFHFTQVQKILDAVHAHIFPDNTLLPSAKEMGMNQFLHEALMHPSFDKDIRLFIIKGAKKLQKREKNFIYYSTKEKERALRSYEKTRYGKNWLGRMMTMGLEAMLSDPIYGSNQEEKGWKALQSYGGFPRPKTRYLEDV